MRSQDEIAASSPESMTCEKLSGIMNFEDDAARFDPDACRDHVLSCENCQRDFPEILALSEVQSPGTSASPGIGVRDREFHNSPFYSKSVRWVAAGILAVAIGIGAWRLNDNDPSTAATNGIEDRIGDAALEIPESVLPSHHSVVQVRFLSFQEDRSLESKFVESVDVAGFAPTIRVGRS